MFKYFKAQIKMYIKNMLQNSFTIIYYKQKKKCVRIKIMYKRKSAFKKKTWFLAKRVTLAPPFAASIAIAFPMPLDPPVT